MTGRMSLKAARVNAGYSQEDVAKQIEKSLSSYDSIYNSLVDTLKKDVDVDNPKVRLVYETSDGQKITEKTWVSKD